jgi:hypothetical protein
VGNTRGLMAEVRYDFLLFRFELSGSPFSRPWLVAILRRDLLQLLGCLLQAVGGLGFPHLPLPSSVLLRGRWLMIENETTRDLGVRVGLLTEEVFRLWRLKLEAPVARRGVSR